MKGKKKAWRWKETLTSPSISPFLDVFLENKIQNILRKNKKGTVSELQTFFGSRLEPPPPLLPPPPPLPPTTKQQQQK